MERRTNEHITHTWKGAVMSMIHADELQPGDVVEHGGVRHAVRRVDRRPGWAWPIASDDDGWAIALDHHLIDVVRAA